MKSNTLRPVALVAVILITVLLFVLVPATYAQSEGRINGVVYLDSNGNGARDTDEEGVRDVEVVFSSAGWQLPVTTQPDGTFGINLNPATWTITIKPPTGYAALESSKDVTIANPGETFSVEFALVASEDGEVLPDSGGPVSEGLLIGGLAMLLLIGGVMVYMGQRRSQTTA